MCSTLAIALASSRTPTPNCPIPDPGLDVLVQLPETIRWIMDLADANPAKKIVIFSVIYLDGELHVRASVAMDVICDTMIKTLGARVQLAYLASPSTCHLWPAEALADSNRRWSQRPWYGGSVAVRRAFRQHDVPSTLINPIPIPDPP